MKDTSDSDFEDWWANQVATKFNLTESAITSYYGRTTQEDIDADLSAINAQGNSQGLTGTPNAYINGVKITVPTTVDAWLDLLNSVYNSQYRSTNSSSGLEFIQ